MKMWDDLVETGVINPKDLARIGNGLESLESVLRSSYSTIRKAPISDNAADAIIKQLDEFAGWLRTNGKSIDEIANANKVGRKTTFKSATDITGASVKTLRQIEKINKTTSTIMLKLRGMKWFPDEKVAQIAKGLERRFKREMRDPLKLTALTKTLPTTDFSTILNVIERQISPRQLAYVRSLDPTSARDVQSIFRYLKQNAPDAYNKISTTIINRSIKTNSPIFNTFKTSDLNNLKTVLSKDMIPAGKTIFTDINLSTRKSLDIIWNEIHDVLESAGLEWDGTSFPTENKIDAADGVVWPALAKAVSEFFPGVYETTVETSESLKNFVTAVGADKGLRAAGELMKDKSKDTSKPKQRGTYK
jgi:isopentenyl phosphate kinase